MSGTAGDEEEYDIHSVLDFGDSQAGARNIMYGRCTENTGRVLFMKKRPREGKRGIGQGDGLASLLKGDF